MVNLPDELVQAILLAHFGRSPLYTLDVDEEQRRRRFLRRATHVSRQFHRLASVLIFDAVLFETIKQVRAFPANRSKRRLVRMITVAPDFTKSGLNKSLHELDRAAYADFTRTRLETLVRPIVSTCSNLIELRAADWNDILHCSFGSLPSLSSLVIGSLSNPCTWHGTIHDLLEIKYTLSTISSLAVFCDVNDNHGGSALMLGSRSSQRLRRLELGDLANPMRMYETELFERDTFALRHLTIVLADYWPDILADSCTAKLLLSRTRALEVLEIGAMNDDGEGNLSALACKQIIEAAPSTLRSLTLDYLCDETVSRPEHLETQIAALNAALQVNGSVPALRQLTIRTLRPPRPVKSEIGKAFSALLATGQARSLTIAAVKA